jgi:Ca2+-binding RTX toxin-like protein
MPIQKTDRDTTWSISADNKTWILAGDARITVNNGNGIDENGHDGSDIRVLGDIVVKGMGAGVNVNGSNSSVLVGADSRINANQGEVGIYSAAAGADIVNRGVILAADAGINGAIWSDIQNFGRIEGNYGILQQGEGSQVYNYGAIDGQSYGVASDAAGTYVENGKGASIEGGIEAIVLDGSGEAGIVNRGILRGGTAAIESGDSELTVRNSGKIFGDVHLGAGEDLFDSRKGSIKGAVEGGDGNDDYYVGAAKVKIVEQSGAGTGFDEVFATASHKLAANVEILHLRGKADIDGSGNGGQNWLYGNAGDNVLKGAGGSDQLHGLGGDDVLTGGGGLDYFIFNRRGVDRITDFDDGTDLLAIDGVLNQSAFDALDIKQVDGDTVINFGGGDRIIIEGLLKSDFDFNDIATS